MEYLADREIHGFNRRADLNINKLLDDATRRWLRPNEVHAILSNYSLFRIQPQPIDTPPNGSLLLFDRKTLRNFRKDSHNWRKKKDGKTVQEAHEKLKIGNEERIHVYYARNEDDPNFYRRCYWLLDRDLERIVLVHYRLTAEESTNQPASTVAEPKDVFRSTTSPGKSVNSANASYHSEISSSIPEEINSATNSTTYAGFDVSPNDKLIEDISHDICLDKLDGFCWKDMIWEPSYIGNPTSTGQEICYQLTDSNNQENILHMTSTGHPNDLVRDDDSVGVKQQDNTQFQITGNQNIDPQFVMGSVVSQSQVGNDQMVSLGVSGTVNASIDDVIPTQNNFGKWDYIVNDLNMSNDQPLLIQTSENQMPNELKVTSQSSHQEQIFSIVDISPAHACCTEETKIIVVGYFHDSHKHLEACNVFCVFGDISVPADLLQTGVYRTTALFHKPGSVSLYLTLDGHSPISQVIDFQCKSAVYDSPKCEVSSPEVDNAVTKQKEFGISMRLAHLLFTTTNSLSVLSNRISPNSMKNARKFESLTISFLENQWKHFHDVHKNDENSSSSASHDLFGLLLKNKLQEWLLMRVAEGCKATTRDDQGQGVIHLCAMLDYFWAIKLFSLTSLSLDFRDANGWTPLHWAAYYGREKTIAALLSAGANPSLVADPSPDFPGGCTPADLASQEGFEGLGAYLAEKGLCAHFQAMALAGNIVSPPQPTSTNPIGSEYIDTANLSEQELCLKDSLVAYRNAADAADRIQTAFRERILKQQMKAAQLANPEIEAAGIVAALKIQKAFRNHSRRKVMKAAVRIQGIFRTWQARKDFLNMRRQAIKIQSIFRGHRERRQYKHIVWSVGILEKAVLRWRLKRKGLRGLQTESANNKKVMEVENCVEEDFYRISREQAEDRVQRSVVRVQTMFRSYRAQQEYRRIKLTCDKAKEEFEEFGVTSDSL